MATVRELLAEAKTRLAAAGVAAPALDARLLLQHATGLSATDLIADQGEPIGAAAAGTFRLLVERRVLREPVSKIIGMREFYGREFQVSRAVLDPRPDSENLVELCLDLIDSHGVQHLLDLGTGSGNLLLTLLAERRYLTGVGVDLSQEALDVAGRNAAALGLTRRCELVRGNWLDPVPEPFDLVVSNPPYIETSAIDELQPEVSLHDPRQALDGGDDGLDAYRAIAAGIAGPPLTCGLVAVEIGLGQELAVSDIFRQYRFLLANARLDLAARTRALAFRAA